MTDQFTGVLAAISSGKRITPIIVTIYGVDGVGKSSFAAGAPNPIFLGLESGTNQLDVHRLPQPQSLGVFLQQLDALGDGEHPFKTIVIDSLDWLEPLIHRQVCAEGEVKSIELYEKGYGRGYIRALEIWRGILARVGELGKRFHVIMIAHSKITKFDDPEQSAGYDRYQIALKDNAAAAIRQASDAVLFANFKAGIKNINHAGTGKGFGEGQRTMFTQCRPAFDAKNRYGLPFEMPLAWSAFGQAVKAFYDGANKAQEPVLSPGNGTLAGEAQTPPEMAVSAGQSVNSEPATE